MNWLDKTNNINTPQMNEKMELIQIVKDSPERNVQFKLLLPWLNELNKWAGFRGLELV